MAVINTLNVFIFKTDGELADLYKQLLEFERTGTIIGDELKKISEDYIKRYRQNGLIVMQQDILNTIAERWYRTDMSELIEAVTWVATELRIQVGENKGMEIAFQPKKKYTFIKRRNEYYLVRDGKEIHLGITQDTFRHKFVQI